MANRYLNWFKQAKANFHFALRLGFAWLIAGLALFGSLALMQPAYASQISLKNNRILETANTSSGDTPTKQLDLNTVTSDYTNISVSGVVTSGIWSGIITMTGDVVIGAGEVVTITPGTQIRATTTSDYNATEGVDSRVELVVSGTLMVNGTASQPVTFTSAADPPVQADWYGLRFLNGSNGLIEYANIEYGTHAFRLSDNTVLTIRHSNIQENRHRVTSGNAYAAGIRASGNFTLTLEDSLLAHNVARVDSPSFGNVYGGYVYLNGGNTVIRRTQFLTPLGTVRSYAGYSRGGGIYATGSGTLSIEDSQISSINVYGDRNSLGGGLYLNNNHTIIQNTVITNNSATDEWGGDTRGGGIYVAGGVTAAITNSVIERNRARGYIHAINTKGGGIYSAGTLHLSGSRVRNNFIQPSGSGADGRGAGIYIASGIANITNSVVNNNEITSTTHPEYGGGIYIDAGQVKIINTLIMGNRAILTTSSSNGGGIYVGGGAVSLINNTIVGNQVGNNGGGVYFNAVGSITNTIVVSNTAEANGGGIYQGAGSISLSFNDVWGNSNNYYPAAITGTNDISVNPLFIDYTGDEPSDYHLTANSLCINAGTPNGAPDDDFDGDLRPAGTGYDIGFDEFIASPDIGGRTFVDWDADGAYTVGVDDPLGNVRITLRGGTEPLTSTSGVVSGTYLFAANSSGRYTLTVDMDSVPTGYQPTTTTVRYLDLFYQNDLDNNFGFLPSSGLTLTKVATPTRLPNQGGWVTYTFRVSNTGQTALSPITVTDPLLGGIICTHPISQTPLQQGEGFVCQTTALILTNTTNVAIANGIPVEPGGVSIPGIVVSDVAQAAVNLVWSAIGGRAYADWDQDGIYTSGDTPLLDVEIELQGADGNQLTTSKMPDGSYRFPFNLTGPYTLTANLTSLPTGYQPTTPITRSISLTLYDQLNHNFGFYAHPKLALDKIVTPTQLPYTGGWVTYTFRVSNVGQIALSPITVTDPLLGGVICTNPVSQTPLLPGEGFTCQTTTLLLTNTINVATVTGIPLESGGMPIPGLVLSNTSGATVTLEAISPLPIIYLPLIMRDYAPPVTFPFHIGNTIPVRNAAYQGEVFYTKTIQIPQDLPDNDHFYLSSKQDTAAEILVDDELDIVLNNTEVFTHSFSDNLLAPKAAIVEIPRTTMENLTGQTITIKYRDIYGVAVEASTIWLIRTP